MNYTRLTKKEIELIKSEKYSNIELCKILNKTAASITYVCKKYNVTLPNHQNKPSDKVNHNFFGEWSNDMAYVLGFVAADGCVMKNKNSHILEIRLSSKDELHLEKIKKLMNCHLNIRKQKTNFNTEAVSLTVCSKEIFNSLNALGIHPRKSLTLDWPTLIPDIYIPHFVRGYFDGDGSVMVRPRGNRKPLRVCSVLGTNNFLSKLKENFNKACGTNTGKIYKIKDKNYFSLVIGGNRATELFLNWIYVDSCDDNRLERKHSRFVSSSYL